MASMEQIQSQRHKIMTSKVCIYGKMLKAFTCNKNKFDKKI